MNRDGREIEDEHEGEKIRSAHTIDIPSTWLRKKEREREGERL